MPHLKMLLVPLRYFNDRPRRSDFPVDDGIDAIERALAKDTFAVWASLEVVSFFARTPNEPLEAKEWKHVWVRDNVVDVRLVGVGDIPPELLSSEWSYYSVF